jgi:chromosome segregation ATPase
MLLATGPLMEFARFLQIISWILLPVLCLAVICTVIIHYRRKKRLKDSAVYSDDGLLLASPADIQFNKTEGVHVLFDHTGLIRQYRNKLSYNHARYTALKQDFERLEMKYTEAIGSGAPQLPNLKNTEMPHPIEQMQSAIDILANQHDTEKKDLVTQLEQLNRSYKSLEQENEFLLEQVSLHSATDEEKDIIVNRWKEENVTLKSKIAEQGYLKDLVEEKKTQIAFLQNQVDQRIRGLHEAELSHKETKGELDQLRKQRLDFSSELDTLKNELAQKQEMLGHLQTTMQQKDLEFAEKQQLLTFQQDQITYFGNVLQEIKQQNELLNAAVADNQDIVRTLREQLAEEVNKASHAQQKLEANQQMLKRLNRVIGECIGEESAETQVIELKPAYINAEKQGWS